MSRRPRCDRHCGSARRYKEPRLGTRAPEPGEELANPTRAMAMSRDANRLTVQSERPQVPGIRPVTFDVGYREKQIAHADGGLDKTLLAEARPQPEEREPDAGGAMQQAEGRFTGGAREWVGDFP